ncbi:MAG: hypothetical protein GY940_38135 [bacterium]|nr:hypothetical protein [bacterium]
MILITDQSIDSRLIDYHVKMSNARDDEAISTRLKIYLYDEIRFDQGFILYKGAFDLHQLVKVEQSEQIGATQAFEKAFEDIHRDYMQHLTISRLVSRGDKKLENLGGLNHERSTTFTGWMGDARQFYAGVTSNAEFLGLMGTYGIAPEALEITKNAVENLEVLKKQQLLEAGDAQNAVKRRDQALEKLHRWVMDLVAIARIALADSPQLLEKINIIVPS